MTSSSRREFLKTSGLLFAGFGIAPGFAARVRYSSHSELIEMRSDALGSRVWFDPVGLYVEPGTTVRWVARENVHTATAYHPSNDRHPLRIPDAAEPWDSGFLLKPGATFDVTLTLPGVYDYYCMPHEAAGMVGRIVVGSPVGPGAEPFDYWVGKSETDSWRHVPAAARKAFPSLQRILAEHRVRLIGKQS